MKTLTLFRHGKSSWKYSVDDEFRPLNKRGFLQAKEMANNCKLAVPQVLYTSSALRAVSTAIVYKNELSIPDKRFHVSEQLYTFNLSTLKGFVAQIPHDLDDVWLFGHNPCFTDLAAYLLGTNLDDIVTSGYVRTALDIDSWGEIKSRSGRLLELNNRN